MQAYQVAVVVKVAGSPVGAEAIAGIAWSGEAYSVYAPEYAAVEMILREFIDGSPAHSVQAALERFAGASHPYAVEKREALQAVSLDEAARSALRSWGISAAHPRVPGGAPRGAGSS